MGGIMAHRFTVVVAALLSFCAASAFAQDPYPVIDVAELTLEEKASLITGLNWWETHPVPRLGIPSVWMADGPVGLRKSVGKEKADTVPATCFPSAAAMAATWDPRLIEKVGAGIGAEAHFNDVILLLAPGLNLKRHPLGGRNFEYYSEDPFLSGTVASAFVRGVQSRGVGATLKHYAVNNQEHRRMSIDAQVDERTLRELYLRGFEIAVRQAKPQAVMSAYNSINGTFASQNHRLLTDILRGEWGFNGMVVSDWGAVDDPVASIAAGLDLEMEGNPLTPPRIVQAVRNGSLEEADLDRAVANVLQLVSRQEAMKNEPKADATAANHDLAHQVAVESMVLLANDGVLPITAGTKKKIGLAGRLAFEPRIQGIGSSQINPTRVEVAAVRIRELAESDGHALEFWEVEYADGGLSEPQRAEIEAFFARQEVVLIFAGQKASHDAEAWDRPSMSLSSSDRELIEFAKAVGRPFVVVLIGGGAVDVGSFDGEANAILMGWLGGQAFGSAVAEVIFGRSAPSGRLSETFARSVTDHPSALNFPGGPWSVRYGEGLYVGYRFFQSFGEEVAFPFGHGLTYTSFEYSHVRAPKTLDSLENGLDLRVRVANTGDRAGSETVQVYLRQLDPSLDRPDRELVGFHKLAIEPGEEREAVIHIDSDRLAYFDDTHDRWVIEPGRYELLVGASATDIRATLPLELTTGTMPEEHYTLRHTLGDIYQDPRGQVVIDSILGQHGWKPLRELPEDSFGAAIYRNLPFRKVSNFSEGAVTIEDLRSLLDLINSDMSPEQVAEALESVLTTDE
jgi:beta-glucosidase